MGLIQRPLTPPMTPCTTQKTVQRALSCSKLTVASFEELPGHLHRICSIRLSNGARLIFKTSPGPYQNLLRSEQAYLESEETVLQLLTGTCFPIPRVLRSESRHTTSATPFLLTTELRGTLYSDIIHQRSKFERVDIERQIRMFRSVLGQYTSSTFGPTGQVKAGEGFGTWKEAFIAMVETLLMDGEDMLVNIPYYQIRTAISRWETYLDDVREARLVIPGLGDPACTIVDPKNNIVTGLLDFGQAIWGDVAFGEKRVPGDIKSLLYVCHNATFRIVKNHYRSEGDAFELEARKQLTDALRQLEPEKA